MIPTGAFDLAAEDYNAQQLISAVNRYVVAGVGNVQTALVDYGTARQVKLAGLGAELAEFALKVPMQVGDHHAVVVVIHHVESTVVGRGCRGRAELLGAGAERSPVGQRVVGRRVLAIPDGVADF